jgi:tetraacyldisaccharide 4'-kinase
VSQRPRPERSFVERIWWGDDAMARVARVALAPLEAAYRGIVALRGSMYDAGLLPARRTALPALSVGNLSVGGTGKTPFAAYVASELRARGGKPAIVLRGYGGDEPLVHATLNPGVPVVVSPDRVAGVAQARVLGADVAVLDDAFQHRRAERWGDIVLVSADRWTDERRLLPAGPWRESARALRRATMAVVTRKAATAEDADVVRAALRAAVPGLIIATVRLSARELHEATGTDTMSLDSLNGRRVHLIAAVGDPRAFTRQVEATSATITTSSIFPDHYRYTREDGIRLALLSSGADLVICTLKDAVKLGPHWPAEAPRLWYVSQQVVIEREGEALAALLDGLLAVRSTHRQHAG